MPATSTDPNVGRWFQRNWTTVGAELELDPEARRTPSREEYARLFADLEWEPVTGEKPMLPGLAIKEAIKELRIPKVTRIAISHELAPYGLYGIEGNYRNGRALVYIVDRGAVLTPVASDFYPVGEELHLDA